MTVVSAGLRTWKRPERLRLSAVTDMNVSRFQSHSGLGFSGNKRVDVRQTARSRRGLLGRQIVLATPLS